MKREQAIKQSEEALKELAESLKTGKSDVLLKYLDSVSQFHQYSFANCMLIVAQKPDATHVAGFQRWKKLGRFVKKGEKGIGIIAPMVGKRKETENSDAEKSIYGFRVVHVFDVSQTEGDDLPELDLSITGDPGDKLERMERFVEDHGIDLAYVDDGLGGALGVSKGGRIEVLAELEPADRFAVLAHELAHELLHHGERRAKTSKVVRELEAEAVAYVVCRSQGLECGNKSSDYIQLYNGDDKLLMNSLEHIQRTSAMILASLCDSQTATADKQAA
ncbi:hypothetical protein V7x_40760 [Crateriforma conspicua]|uniref:N-terminal domain-containing protein n=1 Tax=Crateriforma conspicua TaxID=2527996 RepID=A0A5C6FK42_9PLAN|nr:ArdC-like ssDNA-binding domain-containing protein [Crateriforma conspicua]TWU62347.1 hypothetical protein V7x_40760 [Crateriforma conspicua]